jgi:hypothetical protein
MLFKKTAIITVLATIFIDNGTSKRSKSDLRIKISKAFKEIIQEYFYLV